MKYTEILPYVLKGRWVRPIDGHRWLRIREDGLWDTYPPEKKPSCCDDLDCPIEEQDLEPHTLKPHFMRLDKWEVKPEDIYIWGVCESNGRSLLTEIKPFIDPKYPDLWCNEEGGFFELFTSNKFSKTKPQKYKLIPVEE